MSHLLFSHRIRANNGWSCPPRPDQAVVSVNPRMRAGLMAALHLIRVECPAGPRPLASRGEPAGQGLWAPAWGLICRALAAAASEDEIADLLQAIAPVAGLGRVVCAAPDVAIALG
jgi:hypothetical protein